MKSLYIILDTSSSMAPFDDAKQAIKELVSDDCLEKLGAICIVEMSAQPRVLVKLSPALESGDIRQKILEKINELQPVGKANVEETFALTANLLKAQSNNTEVTYVLLISDGFTDEPITTCSFERYVECFQKLGPEVIFVSFPCNRGFHYKNLKAFTKDKPNHLFGPQEMPAVLKFIFNEED